jgi:hypothetical protein
MELHTLDGKLSVTYSHDDAVFTPGGDFELVGNTLLFDSE